MAAIVLVAPKVRFCNRKSKTEFGISNVDTFWFHAKPQRVYYNSNLFAPLYFNSLRLCVKPKRVHTIGQWAGRSRKEIKLMPALAPLRRCEKFSVVLTFAVIR